MAASNLWPRRTVNIQIHGKYCGDKCILRCGGSCLPDIADLEWDDAAQAYIRTQLCLGEEDAMRHGSVLVA
jgi:hypothetical protein